MKEYLSITHEHLSFAKLNFSPADDVIPFCGLEDTLASSPEVLVDDVHTRSQGLVSR